LLINGFSYMRMSLINKTFWDLFSRGDKSSFDSEKHFPSQDYFPTLLLMDTTLILSSTTLFLMLLCTLFAVFLWTVKTENKLSNRLLAGMLIIISISISVFWYGFYFDFHLGWDRVRDDINILSSPLLFLYIVASLDNKFKLRWIHLLHLVPFALFIILMLPNFYLVDEVAKREYLDVYYTHKEIKFLNILRTIVPISYDIASFVVLYRMKKLILENYSDDIMSLHNWLWQLLMASCFVYLVSTFKSFLRPHMSYEAFHIVRVAMVLTLIGFMLWMVMKALYHPKLFRGIDSSIKPLSKILKEHPNSKEINNADQQRLETIQAYVTTEKPFLDSSLSLQKLARQLSLPSQELSLLINHHLGKHFFDFVNEYRIRAAQDILSDTQQKSKTVLEILYEVGFNSKSSFNTAFKKHTGMTPTQFRKANIK
ncbi:MAG: helix-turn-helix domain-containing protein, partial [Saprospiraceae bacterium]